MAPADPHVAQRPAPELEHLAHHAGAVDGRVGVGHGHDGGVAAEGGGPGAGLDRLGLLPAGLAQVGVEVDQAGGDDAAAGVEDGGAGGRRRGRSPTAATARRRRRGRRPGAAPVASTTVAAA